MIPPPRPYGSPPQIICHWPLPDWHEYMHYLYLPVRMPESDILLPPQLEFLRSVVELVSNDEDPELKRYIYVSARRGFASPGNPINRPGWHADGFGTADVNYIWADRWPTQFAEQRFEDVVQHHTVSIMQFEVQIDPTCIVTYRDSTLLRLDSSVVHAAPEIPAPGGDRAFFKISVSPDKYNLLGNSHNFLFYYDWKMWSRDEIRNDPTFAGGDAGPA